MSNPASDDGRRMLARQVASLKAQGESDLWSVLLAQTQDPQSLTESLGRLLGLPVPRMEDLVGWVPRFDALPFSECARRRCAVLTDAAAQRLIVTDPFDTNTMAWARSRFGNLEAALVSLETFDAWLAHCETSLTALGSVALSPEEAMRSASAGISLGTQSEILSLRAMGGDDSPAVRFINSTLYDALKMGASDIHLETDPMGMAVKFRLDGLLTAMRQVDHLALATQAISRIKVMAELDIAERRVPQDGRLQITYGGRAIDVRVSIMPSIHGEDAVLRILDRQHLAESLAGLTLAKLGFDDVSADALRRLCRKPHGMMLVTGPTGSGKTTTLYAAITETHESRDKVITIEDPVEYQLPGVLQIPVNERKGLDFARGLRSILRHDPDKILVGEIRDTETAQIAVQAALTGHLVFTTVHANSVFDVVGRFDQFGIDAYTFASAVNGVLAQRLLRRLCCHCAVPLKVVPEALGADPAFQRAQRGVGHVAGPLRAQGCERCRGTGYAGRFALGELLVLSPGLKAMLAARAPLDQVQAEAQRGGWRSLRDQAMGAVLAGHTTLEELERVAA